MGHIDSATLPQKATLSHYEITASDRFYDAAVWGTNRVGRTGPNDTYYPPRIPVGILQRLLGDPSKG